jgi:hypothetical protein
MKKLLLTSCLALGLASGLSAGTISVVSGTVGGAATGAVKVTFDELLTGAGPQSTGPGGNGISITHVAGDAQIVTGEATNVYAAPFLSGDNGDGFGGGIGDDTTNYLTTGIGEIGFKFDSKQNYFGLLWGSVDDYNSLEFKYLGAHVVTVTGTDIWLNANGDQGANGTFYVNLQADAGTWYDEVIFKSTGYAFEFDNVAYGLDVGVPDSGATVALLGLSFACLFFFRRKAA